MTLQNSDNFSVTIYVFAQKTIAKARKLRNLKMRNIFSV